MWHDNRTAARRLLPRPVARLASRLAPPVVLLVLAALLGGATPAAAADDAWSVGPGPGLRSGDPRALGAQIYTGQAFDSCRAPSLAALRDWRGTSPFGAVGVYYGGAARACPDQPRLDADWVSRAHAMGWQLLPLYVGSQAPCVAAPNKQEFAMSHHRPGARGESEGEDAVARAKELGMTAGSALYLDMEAYDETNPRCADTTLRFVQGWDRAVRAAGYLPGFYSNANAGIRHIEQARKAGRADLPEMLWFARWHTPPTVYGEKVLDDAAWRPHRRIHQFEGDTAHTYAGRTLHIDRSAVDAPVAVID